IPPEPEVLRRERAAIGEVLRLVARRAEAEAQVEGTRASSDAEADAGYEKARRSRQETVERLEREARAADEQRRRSIVQPAIGGAARARADFAAASRKIAADFDRLRESARGIAGRGKGEALAAFDKGQGKAAREHAEAIKPLDDLARL